MADKLSAVALREVGSTPGVADNIVLKLLDRYAGAMSKEADKRARAAILAQAGAQAIEDFAQAPILRAERDARPTASEEAKHVKAGRREGVIIGMVMGAILTIGVAGALMAVGSRATVAGFAVGAASERQAQNVRTLDALDTQP